MLEQLLEGVELEDGPGRFDRITPAGSDAGAAAGSHASFRVVLREGRNREVRRLWSAVGFEVSRLQRIRYGPIELPADLRPGHSRPADAALMSATEACVGLEPSKYRAKDGLTL